MLPAQVAETNNVQAFMHTSGLCPQARQDEHLVAQEVLEEFVIYDTKSHKVHNLNTTAASVWQWCDGKTRPEELSQRLAARHSLPLDQAEALLWLTLERLEKAHLLQTTVVRPTAARTLDRRRLLRLLGTAAALPVIYSIVAPAAVHAMSVVMITNCNDPGANTGGSGECYGTCNCSGPTLKPTGNCNACFNVSGAKSWLRADDGICYVLSGVGC